MILRRLIFVLGIAAVFLVCIFPIVRTILHDIQTASLSDQLEKIFAKCTRDKLFEASCFRSQIYNLVSVDSISEILIQTERLYSQHPNDFRDMTLGCHGVAHIIGEVAQSKHIPLGTVFTACGPRCDYGCFHGAFISAMKSELGTESAALCETYDENEASKHKDICYHGYGHGIAELYGNGDEMDLLSHCLVLPTTRAQIQCSQGAMMNQLLDESAFTEHTLDDSDILRYCEQMHDPWDTYCYEYAGFYSVVASDDKTMPQVICESVPLASQDECMYSFGVALYFYHRFDPATIRDMCRRNPSFEQSCINGALENYVGEEPFLRYAGQLCDLYDQAGRLLCYERLGAHLTWAWGDTQAQQFCGTFGRNHIAACRRGISKYVRVN